MQSDPRLSPDQLRDLYRGDYVESFRKGTRIQERLVRLLPLIDLGTEMVVADLGCGDGLLLDLLHDRVGHYHGIDFSSEFIAAARRNQDAAGIANATFHCESIVDFCARHPGGIDRFFAMDFTEHVYDEDLLPILAAARRALKSGGRLYVHTPDAAFLLEILKDRGILKQVTGHVAVRSAAQYAALMTAAGFRETIVRHLPHYLPAVGWVHALSWLPWAGRHLRARLFLDCRA